MTTITLPPDIEGPLAEEARRHGLSPEQLALEALRRLFGRHEPKDASAANGTLFDFLVGHIGTVSGPAEALSEKCGSRFTEGLVEEQRQGRL